ncbi:phosphorylated adapter RNA export protein [Neodiprion pinetum]|uniref:Phosphorylated adapter RNA export protein n=1 Tax=Neodiprion lecontei TaxID=441921 RepID=A0A6J0C2B2_NEOLC|nr:phosphorylated adapter RNA export protein [Neodiprion lecontei]XP_046428027.1 phosphorylated adapter RNA export protein [Neodiprion fabricii]XP_046486832.1 phosphorylated adapter RNA export protein [Neodiprion pinetum]XP_046622548.1 phosphorylated adapter RNA export protein [Neodiprion virginianus]
METEPVELEDGEVVDDEVVDAFEYNVLERPHVAPRPEDTSSKLHYSDESDEPTESESDSDSDSAHTCSKKPKMKIKRWKNREVEKKEAQDKYKVWCMQVQEEALTEELVSCGVTKRDYQGRNVEFYDFTVRYSPNEQQTPAELSSDTEKDAPPRINNKRTNEDRTNLKLRLGKRRNSMEIDGQRGVARKILDLRTTADSDDGDVAADIAEKLCEKKDDLIKRAVSIIGKEKAIDFFEQTKKIEEDGGMMIVNGSRRRTPGGVFLLLLKQDDHIPQEKIRAIFQEDRKQTVEQRKQAQASSRRRKTQELMRSLENGSEKDLPALLTRAELSTRQIAEEARLRRGEGRDRERTPPDSDRPVTNPPPSPVTDDPDHTPPSSRRQVQDYAADDFLEIGVDVDSMELF